MVATSQRYYQHAAAWESLITTARFFPGRVGSSGHFLLKQTDSADVPEWHGGRELLPAIADFSRSRIACPVRGQLPGTLPFVSRPHAIYKAGDISATLGFAADWGTGRYSRPSHRQRDLFRECFELVNMSYPFSFCGPATEVELNHLQGARWSRRYRHAQACYSPCASATHNSSAQIL